MPVRSSRQILLVLAGAIGAAVLLVIDVLVAPPIRWEQLSAANQRALWSDLLIAVVVGLLTIGVAWLVVRWSPGVPSWVWRLWLVIGGVASTAAVAMWLNGAHSQYADPQGRGTAITLLLGFLPPVLYVAMFVFVIGAAMIARGNSRQHRE